jgi:hypothetical protein
MKKVISHGTEYGIAIYRHTCVNCGCVFEFNKEDVDNSFIDSRDRCTYWYVKCPECGDRTGFQEPDVNRIELQ